MLQELTISMQRIVYQTQANLPTLGIIILIPWITYILTLLNRRLLCLGIYPRRMHGLLGIVFSPFLHADFNHLFFNTIPLLVLSNFLLINGLAYFIWVTAALILISGLLLWCFGKPGLHIGASGVITGYWAILVSDIYQQGTLTATLLGIISAYYFAGIFLGVFPGKKGISWEGHLFGLLAGFGLSYFLAAI
ncbi:rhomboid family intramembrane serine protease [Legionella londiniensis]|uniref:AraC family transcriptional regulator n=1 Tax=Legionella londiniensis TaxID=45068 RepID=A0A0W0VQW3_9GAMM|nr:rhomboid family intramembrane serine protease [Legionella londiniensis]KTD22399.1 AraC family transcriptional regulator [Legionella londiniensis]STX93027.1 AraC family transcriptional regulator [Legionella londiniensis]